MLVNEKIKSYSMLTARELREMDLLLESDMTDVELEALLMALDWDDYGAAIVQQEADKVVIPISDWLEDEYYMGRVGKSLYKPWKNDLMELFEYDGYDRGIVLGSVGVGKSTFSQLAVLRMLYEASCLRNPQQAYGLAPGSFIHFASLAANKDIAKRVVFGGIVSKIYESPYFQTEFPPIKETGQEVIFPKGLAIIAGSGTDMSVIGLNVAGAIIDEGNFFSKTPARQLKGAAGKSRWGESSKVGRLYESVMRRIKSRYMKRGKLPGMLIVVSSKSTRDSFTEQLINQAHQEGARSVFVKDRNILDVKRGYFSKETFKVLIGTEQYPSKILKEEEDITAYGPDAIVVEVPIDLLEDFESNLDDSLRDLAGVSVARSNSFIGRPERIDDIWDRSRTHPFVCPVYGNPEEWDSRLPYKIQWQKLARRKENGEWEPIVNPELKRVVHLDPALTGDSFGLCIAHISHRTPIRSGMKEDDGSEVLDHEPHYYVDFLLRVNGTPTDEILFKNIRRLIYQFSDHGFHLSSLTTDTFQSREMIQAFREQGYNADLLSVDTSKEPYMTLRTAILDGRVKSYYSDVLERELKCLEDVGDKVDHPVSGSKDLADALCGAIFTLSEAGYAGEPILPEKGERVSDPDAVELNESFIPIKKDVATGAVVEKNVTDAPVEHKVFKKDRPRTLPPGYKKVGVNGKEEDLVGGVKMDELLIRG